MKPNPDDLKNAATAALGFVTLGRQGIDRVFGDGFADSNPELLGAFVVASALVYSAPDHPIAAAATDTETA